MKIYLETEVAGNFQDVFAQFDQSLFEQLAPPFPPVELLRFDGSRPGDEYLIELKLPLLQQQWHGRITEAGANDSECWFVDEGLRMPFFLAFWHHRHTVRQQGDHCVIIDDIEYRAPFSWLTVLLYPTMWAQFAYRKPLYRKIFGRPDSVGVGS
jgi:ligand-binding SRPBCC domain-containing protein